MKEIVLLFTFIIGFSVTTFAQDIAENAIGIRLGDSDAFGTEITYQRALKENNRLEFNLGARYGNNYNGLKFAGLYQWVWNIDGAFNWYAGAGAGIGTFKTDDIIIFGVRTQSRNDSYFFAAGNIGIEYSFDFPLMVSLDARPEFSSVDFLFRNRLGFDIALSARYQF